MGTGLRGEQGDQARKQPHNKCFKRKKKENTQKI
jgi:hypothetical protein